MGGRGAASVDDLYVNIIIIISYERAAEKVCVCLKGRRVVQVRNCGQWNRGAETTLRGLWRGWVVIIYILTRLTFYFGAGRRGRKSAAATRL